MQTHRAYMNTHVDVCATRIHVQSLSSISTKDVCKILKCVNVHVVGMDPHTTPSCVLGPTLVYVPTLVYAATSPQPVEFLI